MSSIENFKRLQEDKVKHDKAHLVLKCILKELQEIEVEGELREHYHEAILLALEHDNVETMEEIIKSFPQAISTKQKDLNLIQLSIVNRCENVYWFLAYKAVTETHEHKALTDKDGNNILHLAAQMAPIQKQKLNMVSGAALQMQKELQWFEEVKKFALPGSSEKRNKDQETPMMVFIREHKELRKEGEEWIKRTVELYTITVALIITIAFAAAITVPGGNDDNTGEAVYATKSSFTVFMLCDAISLFTSTTYLLMCLSILTTRYKDEDFLYELPKRLIISLAMLVASVTSMTVTFGAALYIMVAQDQTFILFSIASFTSLPFVVSLTMQLPFLYNLYSRTYGVFRKQSDGKIILY